MTGNKLMGLKRMVLRYVLFSQVFLFEVYVESSYMG